MMRRIKGMSVAFNHVAEWKGRWSYRMVRELSPALRATDFKCPHYVWYVEEN